MISCDSKGWLDGGGDRVIGPGRPPPEVRSGSLGSLGASGTRKRTASSPPPPSGQPRSAERVFPAERGQDDPGREDRARPAEVDAVVLAGQDPAAVGVGEVVGVAAVLGGRAGD